VTEGLKRPGKRGASCINLEKKGARSFGEKLTWQLTTGKSYEGILCSSQRSGKKLGGGKALYKEGKYLAEESSAKERERSTAESWLLWEL